MSMAELVACSRQLFEGVPGSSEQRAANQWLMQFQKSQQAWQGALHVLSQPPSAADASAAQSMKAPMLVAAQILRLKTSQEWTQIPLSLQQSVRATLLTTLEIACTTGNDALSTASFRILCVTMASIIVRWRSEWSSWMADLQRIVDASLARQNATGAIMLLEILGAIPSELQAAAPLWTHAQMLVVVSTFHEDGDQVIRSAHMALSHMYVRAICCNYKAADLLDFVPNRSPDGRDAALHCVENWILGCIPAHESFGLNVPRLYNSGLMQLLLESVTSSNEEQSQLAAEIIADVFAATTSEEASDDMVRASDDMVRAVFYSADALLETIPLLQMPAGDIGETHHIICRGLSRIASSLAVHHATLVLSRRRNEEMWQAVKDDRFKSLAHRFLMFLLECTCYGDLEVVQPTLEFWFFFLDHCTGHVQGIFDGVPDDALLGILARLVNALILHCRYDEPFIATQQLTSEDAAIEAVDLTRREIADTLLSLFSKWPSGGYLPCIAGMVDLLRTTPDVAIADAILYLLDYMIELVDIESSDSDLDSEDESKASESGEGTQLLLSVLNESAQLPIHPLIINGISRFLISLSKVLVLPGETYLVSALTVCQGLRFPASFPVAAKALHKFSSTIIKYTDVFDRDDLLRELASACNSTPANATESAVGDLIEATMCITAGLPSTDLGAYCDLVLSNITNQIRDSTGNCVNVARAMYFLGRAIHGIQDPIHAQSLLDQVWPLVSASTPRYESDPTYRNALVQFFLNIVMVISETHTVIQQQILEITLAWYSQSVSPEIIRCWCLIITKEHGNPVFGVVADRMVETILTIFRQKLNDTSNSIDTEQQPTDSQVDKLAAEIVQLMPFLRQVLRSFPDVLTRPHAASPSFLWSTLRLSYLFIQIDHQNQEIRDAACTYILDVVCSKTVTSDAACVQDIQLFSVSILRAVLGYVGPKRAHFAQQPLWEFFFQLLHSPRVPSHIKELFQAALSIAIEQRALEGLLPADSWRSIAAQLIKLQQRHRFRQYVLQLARDAEAFQSHQQ